MDHNSLAKRLLQWKADIRGAMEGGPGSPDAAAYPEWYTGLEVSPSSFSRQLGDMQVAMQRANGIPLEGIAQESGRPAVRTSGTR